MYRKKRKQKNGVLFSAAAVALGCLITAIYANRSLSDADDYKVDLSRLDFEAGDTAESEMQSGEDSAALDGQSGADQEVASASGAEMVDRFPGSGSIASEEARKAREMADYLQDQEASRPAKQESLFGLGSMDTNADLAKQSDTSLTPQENVVLDATLSFAPQDGMTWPVQGDVIINYSMDRDVYFETLEQYRYNPAVYIGAKAGDAVSACARGQVTEIGTDAKIGQYVVMDLGSGYQLTYGQLTDLQVKEGSVVARGQIIGSVAKATRYFTLEGDHVYLELRKDGEPVNPLDMLQ